MVEPVEFALNRLVLSDDFRSLKKVRDLFDCASGGYTYSKNLRRDDEET